MRVLCTDNILPWSHARMTNTFSICSWLLVAVGVAMTAWLYAHAWAFVPYLLLSLGITTARGLATQAVMLVVTLCSVAVGFWFFWDAAFIRLSTLNLVPLEVVVLESLVAGVTWLIVHRVERVKH